MGERYSSTEMDGVRIASPEQNKRVVPLDMIPSSLLENIVVQKVAGTFDRQASRPVDRLVYELEDSGERLTPIGSSVFWCDGTSEVYRRVRIPDDESSFDAPFESASFGSVGSDAESRRA